MSINRKAILLMALAMSALATNDSIMRWVGDDLPVGQMMVLRGLFLMAILYTGARFTFHQSITLHQLCHKWCVLRGVAELGATYLFLSSLFLIPLGTATTLVFVSPILLTALSQFVFGERVGPWRWVAVFAGFGGVLLITSPGTDDWNPAMLLPLGAAVMVATRDASTRMVAPDVSSSSVTMATAIIVCVGGLASYPWGWDPVDATHTGWLALAGLIIAVSFFSYVIAIRIGEMSLIAPIQYVIILWATAYGWLIWDEVPDTRTLFGGSIIVASGLLILYRERVARIRAERKARAG
jgi:drug/metabolite transporter (DMT)-like permease